VLPLRSAFEPEATDHDDRYPWPATGFPKTALPRSLCTLFLNHRIPFVDKRFLTVAIQNPVNTVSFYPAY
jgi:hypothetical protein